MDWVNVGRADDVKIHTAAPFDMNLELQVRSVISDLLEKPMLFTHQASPT